MRCFRRACGCVTHREIFRFLFCFQRRFFNLPLQSGNDTGQRKAVAMCRRVGAHCRRRHAGGIKDSVLFYGQIGWQALTGSNKCATISQKCRAGACSRRCSSCGFAEGQCEIQSLPCTAGPRPRPTGEFELAYGIRAGDDTGQGKAVTISERFGARRQRRHAGGEVS